MLMGQADQAAASTIEKAGDAVSVLLPLAGIGMATLKGDRQGQRQFLWSATTNAVITAGLKSAIDKQRPDGTCCNSFPSSHTSFAFMGASFLQSRYGRKFAVPAYGAAAFVAYSRVAADRHYVEDVIAGAAIGYLSSYLFTTRYEDMEITPVAGDGYFGIAVRKAW